MIAMKRILIFGLILLALVAGSASARPLQSLFDLGMGVRVAGLGEAFTGLADDEYALFYNPAGLAKLSQLRVSAFFESHLMASTYLTAAAAMKNLGLGLLFFDLGSMPVVENFQETDKKFDYASFGLLASYGLGLPADLSLGVRLRFFNYGTMNASKSSVSGGAVAVDPGVLWAPDSLTLGPVNNLRVGLLLELPGLSWAKDENFPFGLRIGFSLKAIKTLTIASDFSLADGFHLGGEYAIANVAPSVQKLCVRLGMMTRDGFQLSIGLGLVLSGIQIDYALITHEAGASHRLSASTTLNFKLF
jgi:hypothetical protein